MVQTINDNLQVNGYINATDIISNNTGTLGPSQGDEKVLLDLSNVNNNLNKLKISNIRETNGTTWDSTSTRIQQVTDITNQGYLEFNPPSNNFGIALGVTPGQYAPWYLLYQPESNIQIRYLDSASNYIEKTSNITLVTYEFIPNAFDQPLNTAFSDSVRTGDGIVDHKSKLILARNK